MQYYESGLPLTIRLKLMIQKEAPELVSQPLMNNTMVEAMRMKGATKRRKMQLDTALATRRHRFASLEEKRAENAFKMETFPKLTTPARRVSA